ncbi:type I-E CRISPR-associated protein Cas7/Cse4/CasC [Streptomyces sp. CAU 1734]|uniref:type I-E CRISPR-associated protein Cas7/Cse4/CasC n=1 Tax=Streptomyces sp. CAU 1734 TaxID=3140360 RepID=UPI003261A76C
MNESAAATDLSPAPLSLEIDTTAAPGPYVVVHTLTTVTGVNLNADLDGLPKRALYGGAERLRVSAQSLTRAARVHVRAATAPDQQAATSRLLPEQTARRLTDDHGMDPADALPAAVLITAAAGIGVSLERPGQTKAPINIPTTAPKDLAHLVHTHQGELADAITAMDDLITTSLTDRTFTGRARRKAPSRTAAKETSATAGPVALVPAPLADLARGAFAPGSCEEIALFGRMLAELPHGTQPSSVQIAHSLSVDPLDILTDDFALTDDWQDLGVFGSPMRGVNYLAGGTLYRYAALDRRALRTHLARTAPDTDTERAAQRAERRFVTAAAYAMPAARSSRTGSAVLPTLVIAAGCDIPATAMPAFETPLHPPATGPAADALAAFLTRLPPAARPRAGTARWMGHTPPPALPDRLTHETAR